MKFRVERGDEVRWKKPKDKRRVRMAVGVDVLESRPVKTGARRGL